MFSVPSTSPDSNNDVSISSSSMQSSSDFFPFANDAPYLSTFPLSLKKTNSAYVKSTNFFLVQYVLVLLLFLGLSSCNITKLSLS